MCRADENTLISCNRSPTRSDVDVPPTKLPHGRSMLPRRPGVGTPPPRNVILANPESVPVRMLDGRRLIERGETPALDSHGFTFVPGQQTKMSRADFYDIELVLNSYFPEVEQIIRENVEGADHPKARVLIFDHAIRGGGKHRESVEQVNPYASIVHCDATVRSGHTRPKDQILFTNETEVKYGRLPACWGDVRPTAQWRKRLFRAEREDHDSPEGGGGEHLIVNVWRPLKRVEQWPLALMDARTFAQRDVHPTVLNTFDNTPGGQAGDDDKKHDVGESKVVDEAGNRVRYREGEVLTPMPDPGHRWMLFPQMETDEVLLLKAFDSRRDEGRARFGCHAAVFDPTADADAHRESIEVRCLVVLPAALSKSHL